MLLWMKFGWVPDSSYNVILTFSLVGALLECRGGWGKSSSVGVLWYDSLPWDVFFFISNFCATSWVTKSLMVFLSMFVASTWTMKLWIALISARFFFPFILSMTMSVFGLKISKRSSFLSQCVGFYQFDAPSLLRLMH